jgi:4-diphosphocytidyl-2-C-methyl-D-erythritol kinase
MDRVTLTAPAKLNLRLLVGPLRPDGYHPIRSLMVTLDGLADTVTLTAGPERVVRCEGLDDRANLAWRALDALEATVGRPLPCVVEIDKHIPTQAGLGGGSSDAAATLVGANRLFDLGLDETTLEAVGARIGSDVAFFIRCGAQWAEGRGERLTPAPLPSFTALIVKPLFGLATTDVYRAFDLLPAPLPDDGNDVPPGMPELAGWVRNDLWPAAAGLRPALGEVVEALASAGAGATLLCGSGSAVAGFFDDLATAARAAERFVAAPRTFIVGQEPARPLGDP